MATNRDSEVIGIQLILLAWDTISNITTIVGGDSIELDLWTYLPDQFAGTIVRKSSSDSFPAGVSIIDNRYLHGDPTTATAARTIVLTATDRGASADSQGFTITVGAGRVYLKDSQNDRLKDSQNDLLYTN